MTYKINHKGWRLLVSNSINPEEACGLFEGVSQTNYSVTSSLKDHHRSVVLRINLLEKDVVLKIPKEKNNKLWIRLMTWFRKGEAYKNFLGMEKLWNNDIKTTTPVLAAEKRVNGMVVDSWLLYQYLDGITCHNQPQYYSQVISKLTEMHHKSILHGDPQIRNFIAVEDDIYVIDSNPKPVRWAFDRAYEWAYLRKSAPGIENSFGKINNWWLYRFAYWYDIYERRFVRNRRKIKNFLLGRS